ncbi:hypothetical protein TSMEX_011833 [Taenia solium]|eukprot:TsM_000872200 transcript=TsM_000872200 gene=TsM_000872200
MTRHISNWRWLDKHLCCLLFSQTSPNVDENLLPAIEYHLKEANFIRQYSSQSSLFPSRRLINCCLTFTANIFCFFALYKQDYYHPIFHTINLHESLRRGPHRFDVINILNYNYTAHAKRYDSIIYYDEFEQRKFKGDILNYDCYVFLMDPDFHSRHQLLHLLDAIKPHQILIIAILPRSQDNPMKEMHVFAKFIASFNNFVGCPLATTAVDWRLCCVRLLDTGEVNLEEWMQFVNYDFQFKGIGSRRKEGGTSFKYRTLRRPPLFL